jgi:polyisoprenoid-binding protein YceI
MRKVYLHIVFCLLTFVAFAQNQNWNVVSSSVKFKIKNAGIMVDGSFSGLSAVIQFDASKGFGNKIEASVEAKTVNTGMDSRDNHLRKPDYFSVEQFPKIVMKSTVFSKEPDGKFKGFFTITMKGISNTVPVIFSFTETADKAKFSGSFNLNRLDYKIGESSWVLSNNVTIFIEVNAVKK